MNRASYNYSTSVAQFIPKQSGQACTCKALSSFLLAFLWCHLSFAQDSVKTNVDLSEQKMATVAPSLHKDSLLIYPYNKKRVVFIASANIIGYSAALVALNAAWYKDYPKSNFHVFNDLPEWDQMDKFGHAYSAYAASKISMELWRWTGIERKKRIWLGGMSGFFYQTVIEVLDGYSSAWGWSWGDIGANFLGSAMLISQELAWDEQRIQFKWSFHRKSYDDASLNVRSDKIFGESSMERYLKDYNGQTYWLSTNLRSFFPHSKIPRWFSVAIGTGAEGFFGARANIGVDKDGNIDFYRPDIKRYRQWYLAPDIDLTKIRTKKRGVRMALSMLNIIKFPMPSLEYSNGSMKFNWIHF